MDEFSTGYQEEEYNKPIELEERDYKMQIINVEKTFTKETHLPMLVVELRINEASITFKHRLVKNEYFNANLTKFYDCFKIPRGNFEYNRWTGRVGMVRIHKGQPNGEGKAYWEIHYLVVADKPVVPGAAPAATPAPAKAQPAAQQSAQSQAQASVPDPMPFEDDLVF